MNACNNWYLPYINFLLASTGSFENLDVCFVGHKTVLSPYLLWYFEQCIVHLQAEQIGIILNATIECSEWNLK